MTISWWSFPLNLLRGDNRSTKNINWRDISFCFCYKMTAYNFTARKTIFSFSRRPEKMVFPKKLRWNIIFLVLLGKIFLFPKNMILPPDGKWKMIFLKKITWKYDIFFKCSEKMVFSKRIALGYDLSCTVWERGIVFPKTWYSFPGWKMRDRWPFSRNTRKHDIFYLICSTSPLPKRSKMILSCKNTPNGDWHSRSTP